jgi:hypothetical protein
MLSPAAWWRTELHAQAVSKATFADYIPKINLRRLKDFS